MSLLSVCRPVSYTHLRAHETDSYLVCRLLLHEFEILISINYYAKLVDSDYLGRMGHDLRDSNYIGQQGALKTAYNVLAANTQEGHLHI